MKRKIFVVFFVTIALGAGAQSNEELRFPNWYIGLYSGFNAYMTENNMPGKKDSYFSYDHNVNTLSSACVGYDITQVFSARGLLGWMKYRWSPDGVSISSWTAATATADIMMSIPRLIAGYDPYRIYDIQVFLGGGGAYRRQPESLFSPIVRAGVQANFHISRLFTVNLDIATNFVSDRMDENDSSHSHDNYTSVMVGLTYHLIGCQCLTRPHSMAY